MCYSCAPVLCPHCGRTRQVDIGMIPHWWIDESVVVDECRYCGTYPLDPRPWVALGV